MALRSAVPLVALLCLVVALARAEDTKPPENPDLTAANQLFQSGKFGEAIPRYQQALQVDPKLVPAQAGLVRAYLRDEQVDKAFDLATTFLAAQPNSAVLLAAMGQVQYRRGEIAESEASFLHAIKADPNLPQAYLGLARIYRLALYYRRAYDQVVRAHEIAPQDPAVQRAWMATQPRPERMKALEAYLAAPHPDDAEETAALRHWLEYLKATADQPVHSCKLTGEVEKTESKMEVMLRDAKHVEGYGLMVKINDHNQRLLLDTGASGILINRRAAEKAGLKRISTVQFSGIGEKGERDAYLALADQIRVGELEFKDCVVLVSEKSMGLDEDGLIGADVFSHYIVDIDMPSGMLRLTPLPKRPGETAVKTSLASEEGPEPDNEEQEESARPASEEKSAADKSTASVPPVRLPKDRYTAPEMANWARVYRIGHQLLIPTRVNDSKAMLFILDTGAFSNLLSTQTARSVTRVDSNDMVKVKGLSGEVNRTFNADKAMFHFANVNEPNQNVVTIDLSNISRSVGVEVSGFLGFLTFRQLEVKIDYRDGLVEFTYDPNKIAPALRR